MVQVDTGGSPEYPRRPKEASGGHIEILGAQVAQEAPIPPLEWQPIHPLVFEHPKTL